MDNSTQPEKQQSVMREGHLELVSDALSLNGNRMNHAEWIAKDPKESESSLTKDLREISTNFDNLVEVERLKSLGFSKNIDRG